MPPACNSLTILSACGGPGSGGGRTHLLGSARLHHSVQLSVCNDAEPLGTNHVLSLCSNLSLSKDQAQKKRDVAGLVENLRVMRHQASLSSQAPAAKGSEVATAIGMG